MISYIQVKLIDLIKVVIDKGGSDLHLVAGSPPQIRLDGRLSPLPYPPLEPPEVESLCLGLLGPTEREELEKRHEQDLAVEFPGLGRFRVNLYRQKGSLAGAFRPIPHRIPLPDSLGIPVIVQKLTDLPRGLVLVTGPTGSGKSTTLASLIDKINRESPKHIITVEDPIEFIHEHKKSVISQREIGRDSGSFKEALKYVLRQDPDVILVGEMRDLETISAAITISETGHLVFATLHTNSAVQTINRIIDVFPSHQQSQIRVQLSFVLQGVICQQLLPRIGGGRALAMEVLIPNTAIRNLIREDKLHQIGAQMQMGQEGSGMQTLNQSLAALVRSGTVGLEGALALCPDPEEFRRLTKAPPASNVTKLAGR